MEFLAELGLFLSKSITVVIAIIIVIVFIAGIRMREKHRATEGHVEVKHLNDQLRSMEQALKSAVLDKADFKQDLKAAKQADKHKAKQAAKLRKQSSQAAESDAAQTPEKRIYVVDFDGDIRAQAVDSLRQEITVILAVATTADEVVIRLESSGGVVHGYGLAASQLQRIKDHGVKLTVCVDKIAASGGYMMACVADTIVSAPFAAVGSIGVVGQLPNFHRLLKQHNIDYEMITAGEYKRTLTVLGENTDKGREKFKDELEDTHALFKDFVTTHRPQLDIDRIATGEVWFGQRALEQQLVDQLETSDALLSRYCKDTQVYEVKYVEKKPLPERIGIAFQAAMTAALQELQQKLLLK